MVRTTWLRERRVEEFEDALGRLEGKRPSAMDAAQATVEERPRSGATSTPTAHLPSSADQTLRPIPEQR